MKCFGKGALAALAGILFLFALPSRAADQPAIEGERLSDWLLRRPASDQDHLPGLMWQVESEKVAQAKLKAALLDILGGKVSIPAYRREALAELVERLPVTGRVRVPIVNARWLQAHPQSDPVLSHGHRLAIPVRPNFVTVITDNGRLCRVPHRPGIQARSYLLACQSDALDTVDRVWLIQSDGVVAPYGIASWNSAKQDEPGLGATIWAPSRNTRWPRNFSSAFAEMLATQGALNAAGDAGYQGVFAATGAAIPDAALEVPRDPMFSTNDWGLGGLLQTPSARMAPAGDARFSFSRVLPYDRSNIIFQPFDWLEAGFRYTNVANRLYGSAALSGDQTYKDKSIDVKIKVANEQAYLPQLAVGVTDLAGTGLFSSEYIVANKRAGSFDWSLGMAWGYLGNRSDVANPLSKLNDGFSRRPDASSQTGQGGVPTTGSYFRGRSSLFGGVQYQTPWKNLAMKLEYDGNNYQNEPQSNNQAQTLPFNMGLLYRYNEGLDLNLGVERGNTLMFGLTLRSPLDKLAAPKIAEGPMLPVTLARPTTEPNWSLTAATISELTRWSVGEFSQSGTELQVVLNDPQGTYWEERIDRAMAVLHRDAPADIDTFVLTFAAEGLPLTERVILRDPWVLRQLHFQAMSERADAVVSRAPGAATQARSLWRPLQGKFAYDFVPTWQQNLGGPDGFLLYRASATVPVFWKATDHITVTGAANLGLFDNYDKFKYDIPSNLPRVRTLLREYTTQTSVTIPYLQATTVGRLSNNQFYSVYGGMLESMYAGVGGEWLYRPWHSPLSFGVDVNAVRQRDFKQWFELRDYSVMTGHATLNWDTGWNNTHLSLSAGRYLAGDIGTTLDISRTYNNGVSIGAWATKTNVSAEQFGEGSFDKGIYLRVPFDAMMTSYSGSVANLVWQPIVRDGGAKLSRNVSLYNLTKARDKRQTSFFSALDSIPTVPADEEQPWLIGKPRLEDMSGSVRALASGLASMDWGRTMVWGGSLLLASSLLDRPMDDWARSNQSGPVNSAGEAASALPYLLAGGTGLLALGFGDKMASDTAWSSIKAAGFTLGGTLALKAAVGRSLPKSELGTTDFSPFGGLGRDSAFPSNHVGVAFALVTPFAQQYNKPWLYALAASTALGRIQQREHFFSDTVASGLIGYVAGSLMRNYQSDRRKMPTLEIGPNNSFRVTWEHE